MTSLAPRARRSSVLLIDNYDSFVHNLARYVRELGVLTEVFRNDALGVDHIRAFDPAAIILSPGPCTPDEAGVCLDVVRQLGDTIPLLGVCLGHQAIVAALGGRVVRAPRPVHGQASWIRHRSTPLFAGLPDPLRVGRYHSLIAEVATLPADLEVTAWTEDGLPMAVEHRRQRVFGVQFHPESILTEGGHRLLANFLTLAGLPIKLPGIPLNEASGWAPREAEEPAWHPLPQQSPDASLPLTSRPDIQNL